MKHNPTLSTTDILRTFGNTKLSCTLYKVCVTLYLFSLFSLWWTTWWCMRARVLAAQVYRDVVRWPKPGASGCRGGLEKGRKEGHSGCFLPSSVSTFIHATKFFSLWKKLVVVHLSKNAPWRRSGAVQMSKPLCVCGARWPHDTGALTQWELLVNPPRTSSASLSTSVWSSLPYYY